jgi:uncharacterized membrane protein SpoIIM required for sporulation
MTDSNRNNSKSWFNKSFALLVLGLWIGFWLLMYVAANGSYLYGITSAGQSAAKNTLNQRSQVWQTWTVSSVFVNNFEQSIMLVIPVLGLILFLFVMNNTGQFIGLLAAATGTAPWFYILELIFASNGVGILEIGAYALLAAEATYVLYLWITHQDPLSRIKTHSWKSFLLYVVLLFVAAWLEVNL